MLPFLHSLSFCVRFVSFHPFHFMLRAVFPLIFYDHFVMCVGVLFHFFVPFFVHGIFIQVLEKLCFVVNLRMCHNFCLLRCFIAAAHILYISTCMVRHQQLNNFPLFKHSLPEVCVFSLSLSSPFAQCTFTTHF